MHLAYYWQMHGYTAWISNHILLYFSQTSLWCNYTSMPIASPGPQWIYCPVVYIVFMVFWSINHSCWGLGPVTMYPVHPKSNSLSDLAFCLSITSFSVNKSFLNFAQSTTVTLSCSVRNFRWICQKRLDVMGKKDFVRFDILDGFPILRQALVYSTEQWINDSKL